MLDSTQLADPPAEVRRATRLNSSQRNRLKSLVETVREFEQKSLEAAVALSTIKKEGLFLQYDTFPEFVREEFGLRRSRAYQLAKAGALYEELKSAGVTLLPTNEGQLRPLTRLDTLDDQKAAWKRALEMTGELPNYRHAKSVTKEQVALAVAEVQGAANTQDKPPSVPTGSLPRRELDYAVVEDTLHRDGGTAPSEALHAEHYALLLHLDPRDQAAVWRHVGEQEHDAKHTSYDQDGRLKAVGKNAVADAVLAVAEEEAASTDETDDGGTATPIEMHVLLERHLLDSDDASALEAGGAEALSGSLLTSYEGAEQHVADLIEALDQDEGIYEGITGPERARILARRRMIRARLEPDVATWAWSILIPHPARSATRWLPEEDSPAPCYVPARLIQPSNTKPLGPDLRTPTARTVLIAPGMDLLHASVPDGVVEEVLKRAGAAESFAFLATTRDTDRLAQTEWPENVRPVVPVETEAELERAVTAFEKSGCRGVLAFLDFEEEISDELSARIAEHTSAALLRGEKTGQKAYDALLALRARGLALLIGNEVPVRVRDTLFAGTAVEGDGAEGSSPTATPAATRKVGALPTVLDDAESGAS